MIKTVLIMAGGIGERLWPLSREKKPKQFLSILGEKSLIEETILRASLITDKDNIFIVTGQRYEESFYKYIPDFKKENIIFEPLGKDTAPAITLGALTIQKKIPNSTLAVIPADPVIKDIDVFVSTMNEALNVAYEKNKAVVVGITPTRAETGYGYIKLGENLKDKTYKVETFVEKPNIENAERFFSDGGYLWNSGMFIWNVDSLLSSVKNLMGDMYKKTEDTLKNIEEGKKEDALKIFSSIEKKSFDVGIMERLSDTLCVKGDFFWDDLGAFSALERICNKDKCGNVILGNSFIKDGNNNIIVNEGKLFIACHGVNNLTIVESNGALLIYPNGEDNRIKDILKDVREKEELKDRRDLL